MSGVEVVALVAGIVSAYSGASTMFTAWRQRRRERKAQQKNENLDQALTTSGPNIQQHYDDDFRQLGQRFARGDETGRSALMAQMITLQQTVIALLSHRDPLLSIIHPDHNTLLNSSNSVRENSIRALTDQFQRMSQSSPIARSPSAPTSRYPSRPAARPRLSRLETNCRGWVDCLRVGWGSKRKYKCRTCSWKSSPEAMEARPSCDPNGRLTGYFFPAVRSFDNQKIDHCTFLRAFHARNNDETYWCYVCKDDTLRDFDDMRQHCSTHLMSAIAEW